MTRQDRPDEASPDRPRIYVASLADYNAGRLHGAWLPADCDDDELWESVRQMLAHSREPIAEEWAIHDYEGFGPLQLSEFEDLATVARIGRGIAECGEAFAAWAAYLGAAEWDDLDRFDDAYRGEWSSLEDYAESLLDDMGIDIEALGPEELQPYITFDVDAFARDLACELGVVEADHGVYVFDV